MVILENLQCLCDLEKPRQRRGGTTLLNGGRFEARLLFQSENLKCFSDLGKPWQCRLWASLLTACDFGAEASGPGGKGQEAEETRVSTHWANGLQSGLLPQVCGAATPEVGKND